MFHRLRELFQGQARAKHGTESDVEHDPAQARDRTTGGRQRDDPSDAHSTTGPSPNETFVGRVAGEDSGYLDTGAERRADPPQDDDQTM